MQTGKTGSTAGQRGAFWVFLLVLAVVLGALFHESFKPGVVHFANDFPVGNAKAEQYSINAGLTGYWLDLNWLGQGGGAVAPGINALTQFVLGPIGYSKFVPPVVSLILGLCAWVFFRQAGLSAAASGLGALAAALNMNFLSNACWGLGTRSTMLAAIFLALAALVSPAIKSWWLRGLLAGGAVGLSIIEGFDNGAIFSIYVGIFGFFVCCFGSSEGSGAKRFVNSTAVVALTASFAAVVAYQAIQSVIGTSIKGMTLTAEQQMPDEQKWDWATQWSTPKLETLRVVIPGLFGYRMDATMQGDKGGEYWGTTGQQPGWEQHRIGFPRHSGSGEYAGVLVVLVAFWAILRALPKGQSVFSERDRRIILFWAVAAVISLVLAWGRHAPFYRMIYLLPYFNTIRNPMKFMHAVHLALMILCAYGFDGLWRLYVKPAATGSGGLIERLQKLWAQAKGSDRSWLLGCLAVMVLSVFGVMIYTAGEKGLVQHLIDVGFPPEMAPSIAKFSKKESWLFLGFLAASMLLVAAIMTGWFSGSRARWALIAAGLLMVVDLGRANSYFILHYRYAERYASNPVLDFLRQRPYEHRVSTTIPFGFPDPFSTLMQVYQLEWAQHQFPFYNIQSSDVVQMPREPVDYARYRGMRGIFSPTNRTVQVRYWQLTNTRYLLGIRGAAEALNNGLDPAKRRFREAYNFSLAQPSAGVITAQTNPAGPFTVIEFTGALPRAGLYAHWENQPDDEAALKTLASEAFDPEQTVIVAGNTPAAPPAEARGKKAGTVEFTSYAPKRFTLKAKVESPAVLLINDRYDPQWKVWVDGQPAELLRCNYVMRGVALQPGEHTVELRYLVDLTSLYVSLGGIAFSLLLCGWVVLASRRSPVNAATPPK
jgi:hypothetical protein